MAPFSPEAQVVDDLPCQGCGYNLREAKVSGVCPECGRLVRDSLVPLDEPDKVAAGLRYIGNSYLGMLALPLVPFAVGVAGSCAGWVGMLVLLCTSLARASGVADLRYRSSAGRLPVIGPRVNLLWNAALADAALVGGSLLLMLAGAAGGDVLGWVNGLAGAVLFLWLLTAAAVAALAGWTGMALAGMLGYQPLVRRLRFQWKLMASGPAVAVGAALLCVMMGAVGGTGAKFVMGSFAVLALGGLWLVGVILTISCMSELAKVVERVRDARENAVREPQMQSLPASGHAPGPRPF